MLFAFGLAPRWNWIDDHVLLGALPRRRDLSQLRKMGVTGVINMCEECPGDIARLNREQIEQLHLPVLDYHSPALDDVQRALDFINSQRIKCGKTYIYCKAGRGRSATVALCYLMKSCKLDPTAAMQLLVQRRPRVSRSIADREVVKEFDRFLQQSRAKD